MAARPPSESAHSSTAGRYRRRPARSLGRSAPSGPAGGANQAACAGKDAGVEAESDAAVILASLQQPARFGTIFDRHATVLHRYLVRRLGPDEAEAMVGEVFRVAFEKRHTYDVLRPAARPW